MQWVGGSAQQTLSLIPGTFWEARSQAHFLWCGKLQRLVLSRNRKTP